jgi:membrane protein implicated in regulation of membrane protease activity
MDATWYDLIDKCLQFHAPEILFGLAVVLILIDYFFPTDLPAQFGYLCLSLAVFFVAYLNVFPLWACLVAAAGFFVLLAYLHRSLFCHFLTNAPGTERYNPNRSKP